MSAETDERTRFEVYYPPFEGAIEARERPFSVVGESDLRKLKKAAWG